MDRRSGKGKRGGLRLIYYHFLADSQVWLITYDKDSMADLSPTEKRPLKAAIERETRERAKRRTERRSQQ